jgi:hypothetical protein
MFLRYLGLALLLLWVGCASPGTAATDRTSAKQRAPAKEEPAESREVVRLKKPVAEARVNITLPQKGVLVAFVRWGLTTLGVFDVASGKLIRLATKQTGDLVVAQAANRLAYLVREGPNPAKNTIEILDFRRGEFLVVEPATDYAILGFTLSPEGRHLSYAAMNIRASRSTQVTGRAGLADLERQEIRVTLTSNPRQAAVEGIPVPFEWSNRTGRIYLQGWLPFRGMVKQSIWAIKPDGTNLTRIIPEPDYTGIPRLSPDGSRLSFLATELESLPRDYVAPPGAPPGNALFVMNLATGDKEPWAQRTDSTLGTFGWSESGEEILAVEQAWQKGRFRDVEILRIGKGKSVSVEKIDQSQSFKEITGILECRDGSHYWVEKNRASAKLHVRTKGNLQALFDLPEGSIRLLGCLNR